MKKTVMGPEMTMAIRSLTIMPHGISSSTASPGTTLRQLFNIDSKGSVAPTELPILLTAFGVFLEIPHTKALSGRHCLTNAV